MFFHGCEISLRSQKKAPHIDFYFEKVSEAAPNIDTSVAPASTCNSQRRQLFKTTNCLKGHYILYIQPEYWWSSNFVDFSQSSLIQITVCGDYFGYNTHNNNNFGGSNNLVISSATTNQICRNFQLWSIIIYRRLKPQEIRSEDRVDYTGDSVYSPHHRHVICHLHAREHQSFPHGTYTLLARRQSLA